MTKFEVKITTLPEADTDRILDYARLAEVCVNTVPQGAFGPVGISGEEMRKRIRVLDVISNFKPEDYTKDEYMFLEFEDADFEILKKCVNDYKWPQIHKEITQFIDYVSNLKPEVVPVSPK